MGASDRPAPMLPGLLARKGEARPAMRPGGLASALVADDDLGWNDLGGDSATVPQVLREREQLRALTLGSDALAQGDDTVVTIRLDRDRLWRLRLAAAQRNQAVEAWLVDAIDRLLPPIPDPSDPAKVRA